MKSWIKKVVKNRKQDSPNLQFNQINTQSKVVSFDRPSKNNQQFGQQFNNQYQQNPQQTTHVYTLQIARKIAEQQPWTQAEAQIINQLINMDFLIKVSKNIEDQFIMLVQLKRILCSQQITLKQLGQFLNHRKLPFQYYPIRALLWKIQIGYLPQKKQKWISLMEGSLLKYQNFLKIHISHTVSRKKNKRNTSIKKDLKQQQAQSPQHQGKSDHPLNIQKNSKWKTYFQDYQLWNLIEQDTIRTRKSCNFFQQQHILELNEQQFKQQNQKNETICLRSHQLHLSKNSQKNTTYYYDALTRILFIYCKQHPQIGYWQGMNELAAVIYYCFTNKNSQYFRRVSESDSYFVFQKLMQLLGKKHFGMGQKYSIRFMQLLKKVDNKLCQHFEQNKIDISVFVIKWLISLFSNEFQIDHCLFLWDGILSAPKNYKISVPEYLMYLGLAILHLNRKQILQQGSNPLILLSKINQDPHQIITKARNIFKYYQKIL